MKGKLLAAVAAISVTAGFATGSSALDATTRQRIDTFAWQRPDARSLDGKTEDELDVNSAGYADNAGQLGGRDLTWVRNNGLYAADAGSVDAAGITGIGSCASGYALKKTATGFTCVNRVSGADVAYSVDDANITGVANCASGYVLTRVSGGFTCINTIQNATSGAQYFSASCSATDGLSPPTSVSAAGRIYPDGTVEVAVSGQGAVDGSNTCSTGWRRATSASCGTNWSRTVKVEHHGTYIYAYITSHYGSTIEQRCTASYVAVPGF